MSLKWGVISRLWAWVDRLVRGRIARAKAEEVEEKKAKREAVRDLPQKPTGKTAGQKRRRAGKTR